MPTPKQTTEEERRDRARRVARASRSETGATASPKRASSYDFADFELGELEYQGVLDWDEVEALFKPLIEKKRDHVVALVRRLLAEIFHKYQTDGHWAFRCKREQNEDDDEHQTAMRWYPAPDLFGYVPGIGIDFSPANFVAAFEKEARPQDFGFYDWDELTAAVGEWRSALTRVETLLTERLKQVEAERDTADES
jgi:hypothetical protein